MIIDPKEQKEFFNVPDSVTSPEEFKNWFNGNFILKEKAAEDPTVKSKVSGGILGSEMTNFYRKAKEKGIEFNADEKKAIVKNEDLFDVVLNKFEEKLVGTYVNQIEELKKSAGQGSDEKIKAIELEKEKLAKKLSEVDAAWKTTASELEKERQNSQSTLKSYQVNTLIQEAEKGVKLKQKMTEAERMGWEAAKKERLKFDLSEDKILDTFNSKGERIVSKQKAGSFLGATEALQELANELGLAEINPHGGKPVEKNNFFQNQGRTQQEPTGKTVLVRGKAQKV